MIKIAIIPLAVEIGTYFGLSWIIVNWFGVPKEALSGAAGIPMLITSVAIMLGVFSFQENND